MREPFCLGARRTDEGVDCDNRWTRPNDLAKEHLVNTAHHGRAPDDSEGDPTGMRDVLRSLPDPGPMPDSVTTRIQHSLEAEGEHSARSWAGTEDVTDLVAERHRRRPAQWVMAAAAVVAVGVIGTVVVDQVLGAGSGSGDAAAQYAPSPDQAGSGSESEGEAEAGDDAASGSESRVQAGDQSALQESAEGESAGPSSVLGDLDDQAFATGALLLLQDDDGVLTGLPAEFSYSPAADALPARQVDSCVEALGEDPTDGRWTATPATINGSDVIVLGDMSGPQSRAWAVGEECPDGGRATILTGPVELP